MGYADEAFNYWADGEEFILSKCYGKRDQNPDVDHFFPQELPKLFPGIIIDDELVDVVENYVIMPAGNESNLLNRSIFNRFTNYYKKNLQNLCRRLIHVLMNLLHHLCFLFLLNKILRFQK